MNRRAFSGTLAGGLLAAPLAGGRSRCLQRERAANGQADREWAGDRSPLGPPNCCC